ncbi:hypothetical protein [Pseudomonas sp. EMN2]|uniref:hypothetical protein n=1 Tax=Pseudomonas sp. EMN2 TaxID=2615212 RepID=UPI00129A6CF7|nr:hypothetical protein [Pseudomonas sp. EMN2]
MSWSIDATLPEGWTSEKDRTYGTIITAVKEGRQQGSVTICEEKRSFCLGIAPPRTRGDHKGRGWKAALYGDAVKALQEALK